jgi:hypothetical protein
MRKSPLALVALLVLPALAAADDLLPPATPIETAVDHYLDARLREEGIAPAPPADDATLLRRITLDLVGRIPTVAEADEYSHATDPGKRVRLVERLMASPGFVRHEADEFDAMMMAGTSGSIRGYLTRALAENRPWDRIFREVEIADESDPKQQGASEFLRQRLADADKLTSDVSVTFFGVNVSCARCHDHPLVPDWKQDHFFGMKSFFSRTFDNGGFLAERDYGVVKFKTVKGADREAKLMFLTGKVVDAPAATTPAVDELRKEKERFEVFKKSKKQPPLPKFSARTQLVDLALLPGQRDFFARSIANRLWHQFFGTGLVMPVDQMHAENPASHPELLQWLARDMAEHGYDLRRTIRGLVLSTAYARSSRWEGQGPTPRPQFFAVARVRALTPTQMAASLRLATADPVALTAGKPEEVEKRVEGLANGARGMASWFELPGDDFQIGVGEALLFSNADRAQKELLGDGGDRLLARLKSLPDRDAVVDCAVRAVLSRPPNGSEKELLGSYLARRPDRQVEARRQLVWALLTSAEFRFNY